MDAGDLVGPEIVGNDEVAGLQGRHQDLVDVGAKALAIDRAVEDPRCGQPRDPQRPVTYDTRTTFRRLRARATPAAARAFRRSYYGRPVKPVDRRAPLTWASVPDDYDEQIRTLRRARGLSQGQLATLVGAARKAVVYQWEARKRTPSPVFWQRITALHR